MEDVVVLQDSFRLMLRLVPCDVVVRVAPAEVRQSAEFEVALATELATLGGAVAALDPRCKPEVYERDGFVMNFWTYYETRNRMSIPPDEYADALELLHRRMRGLALEIPHFTERVAEALAIVDKPERSPDLAQSDRDLLRATLRDLRRAVDDHDVDQQPLHGEPHPGNVLDTTLGLRFIDLETCCRGPIEFDLAHAPDGVGNRYQNVDPTLLARCRTLALAMVAAWRCDRTDDFPDGRRAASDIMRALRTETTPSSLDAVNRRLGTA